MPDCLTEVGVTQMSSTLSDCFYFSLKNSRGGGECTTSWAYSCMYYNEKVVLSGIDPYKCYYSPCFSLHVFVPFLFLWIFLVFFGVGAVVSICAWLTVCWITLSRKKKVVATSLKRRNTRYFCKLCSICLETLKGSFHYKSYNICLEYRILLMDGAPILWVYF